MSDRRGAEPDNPTLSYHASGRRDSTLTSSARRLRIAVWHHLPSGGGRRALSDQVKGLVARGHHVEIWTPEVRESNLIDLARGACEHVIPLDRRRPPGSRELWQLLQGVRGDIDAMGRHCLACAREIDRGGFDVLLGCTSQDFAVTSIARATSLPSVLYLQEPLRELYEALPTLPWVAGSPQRGLRAMRPSHLLSTARELARIRKLGILAREERLNAAAFDTILVNSQYSRESVRRAYGMSSAVCRLGVDVSLFRPLGLNRENAVVGVGSLVRLKRPDLVIEAIRSLPPPRPCLNWIANSFDSGFRDEIMELASNSGVDFRLHVGISDHELVRILNTAAVFAFAPLLEPLGLAPLEAGACCLPVVAVGEGGVRETVFDGVNGLLVADRAEALGGGLKRILRDPGLGARLGEAGRRLVESEWSLDSAVTSLEDSLHEAIAERRGGRP